MRDLTLSVNAQPESPPRPSLATLWTRRKFEPNREHALEVLADSWHHLLCDD